MRNLKLTNPNIQPDLGGFVTFAGERYYQICDVDDLPPFFISLAARGDHWLFISSSSGLTAGRSAPGSPFIHGAAAAFIAWGIPQIISVVVNVAQDDGVNVVSLFFNGLLAASIGVVGAGIGIRRGTLDNGDGESTG